MKQNRMVLTALILGTILSALEYTVIAAVAPRIILDLGNANLFAWATTGYMVTATMVALIGGKLCDRIGRKQTYFIGLIIFAIGCTLCGFSNHMMLFIVSRAIQGIGGGMLIPAASTIAGDIYEGAKRAKIQGLFASFWGISAIIGPQMGSFIASVFNWRWLFFINLPIVAFIVVFISIGFKDQVPIKKNAIDYKGMILLSLIISGFLLFWEIQHWSKYALLGLTIFLTYTLIRVERTAKDPLLDMKWTKKVDYLVMYLLTFILGANTFIALTFFPFAGVFGLGKTMDSSANLLIPLALGAVGAIMSMGRMMTILNAKRLAAAGLLTMLIGDLLMTMMPSSASSWLIYVSAAMMGFGTGVLMPLVTASIQQGAAWEEKGMLTAYISFFRSIGGTLGAVIAAFLFRISLPKSMFQDESKSLNDLVESIVNNPLNKQSQPLRQEIMNAIHPVFWMCVMLVITGLLSVSFLSNIKLIKVKTKENSHALAD